jgi:hypothetical protein
MALNAAATHAPVSMSVSAINAGIAIVLVAVVLLTDG